VNYREPDCPLGIECSEKYTATHDSRPAELDLGSDGVRT
jgi:hypothetical protein